MNIAEVPKAYHFAGRGRRPLRGQTGSGGGRKASISAGGGGLTSEAAAPASRQVGGMADGVEGPPQIETQQALNTVARQPRFSVGNPGVGTIDLGSILSERTNAAFDPSKPIGGANVPYKETTGIGGVFRRLFGDRGNEMNAAAQAAQGADWRAEDVESRKWAREDARDAAKDERAAVRDAAQTAAADARLQKQLDAQKAEGEATREAQRIRDAQKWVSDDAQAEQAAIDRSLALAAQKEQNQRMYDLARKELDLKSQGKPAMPQIHSGGEKSPTIVTMPNGELMVVEPPRIDLKTGQPLGQTGLRPLKAIQPPPAANVGVLDVPVDPATGQPLVRQPAVLPVTGERPAPLVTNAPAKPLRGRFSDPMETETDPYVLAELAKNPPLNWSDSAEVPQVQPQRKLRTSLYNQGWRIE